MMRKNDLTGPGMMLGGLAAGLAAMYLMDPERGPARRAALRETAEGALSSLGDSASGPLQHLSGLGGVAGSAVSHLSEHAKTVAGQIGQHFSDHAGNASTAAHDFVDRASASAHDTYDRARTRFGVQPDPSTAAKVAAVAAPAVMSAGTAALLGAAAIYFLDPDKGSKRRQATYDAVNGIVASARQQFDRLMGNGEDAETSDQTDFATSDDYVDDEIPEVGRTDDPKPEGMRS